MSNYILMRGVSGNHNRKIEELECLSLKELLDRYTDSNEQPPPRRGLKDNTYRRVLINRAIKGYLNLDKTISEQPIIANKAMKKHSSYSGIRRI